MELVVSGDTPSQHPALYLFEQLLTRMATTPRGRIILFLNGGRITNQHTAYLLTGDTNFQLQWQTLSPLQRAAAQAVADLMPALERARVDGQLIVRIRQGQPQLPLVFQGRYPVVYEPDTRLRAGREGRR